MKRLVMLTLVAAAILAVAGPAFAFRRVVVRGGPHRMERTTVVVRRGWPLRRPLRPVFVSPSRVVVRVEPAVYLAPVYWGGVMVQSPPPVDAMVWEDSQTLDRRQDWTEFTLDCDTRGDRLWIEVANGKVQFDWAEVTFGNGETAVVDMKEWTRGPGLYSLLDFRNGRMVDHVRVVARAKSDQARVVLRMEK